MKHPITRLLAAVLAVAALALVTRAPWRAAPAGPGGTAHAPVAAPAAPVEDRGRAATDVDPTAVIAHPEVGFHSRQRLEEHFEKHGAEFGAGSPEQYLKLAQTLRDRPAGGAVLEAVRDDGVVTRFDRRSGAFLAFDHDLEIRTFFRPHDGERYFQRQLEREHGR